MLMGWRIAALDEKWSSPSSRGMGRKVMMLGFVWACSTSMPAVTPIPLAKAAAKFGNELPKGAIVTAECVDGTTTYTTSGALEMGATPPEKVIFEIGSISKVFTGLLLAQAVLEKKVSLDTTLREVLVERRVFADPAVAAITLRQLVTHTSGLPRLPENLRPEKELSDPYATYDRAMLDAAVAAQKLEHKPPFAESYSNYGMGLLGDILSRVHGRTWADLVRERITEPLGMIDTTVTLSREQQGRFAPGYDGKKKLQPWTFSALAGAGALRSTAADMIKFGEALLAPEKTPLKEAITLMLQPQTAEGDIGFAIGLSKLDGQDVREHNGGTGGYRSLMQVMPATRSVRVILTNNSAIAPESIIAASRNEKPRRQESDRIVTSDQLAEYEGVYPIVPEARFTVLRRGDQLWTQLTGQTFLRLFPHEQDDRFFFKVVSAELQFHRENGKVVSLTNHQNGRELNARKSDGPVPKIVFRGAKELTPYVGTYELAPKVLFTLKTQGETLFAQLTGQPPAPVFEKRDDWFEYDVVDAALEFERGKDGKVTALKLHQNGAIQRAVKKGETAR
jgi:serine-type D-Ala-D-Ala carboxypeptidase/endopeptidase